MDSFPLCGLFPNKKLHPKHLVGRGDQKRFISMDNNRGFHDLRVLVDQLCPVLRAEVEVAETLHVHGMVLVHQVGNFHAEHVCDLKNLFLAQRVLCDIDVLDRKSLPADDGQYLTATGRLGIEEDRDLSGGMRYLFHGSHCLKYGHELGYSGEIFDDFCQNKNGVSEETPFSFG